MFAPHADGLTVASIDLSSPSITPDLSGQFPAHRHTLRSGSTARKCAPRLNGALRHQRMNMQIQQRYPDGQRDQGARL